MSYNCQRMAAQMKALEHDYETLKDKLEAAKARYGEERITLKATWSVHGFLFLLQNHVIRYKLYVL